MSRKYDYQLQKDYKYPENNPEYKGNDLDHELATGPLENRSCQDCLFLIIFIALWAGLVAIAGVAFKSGEPARLASPYDSDGEKNRILSINFPYLNFFYSLLLFFLFRKSLRI